MNLLNVSMRFLHLAKFIIRAGSRCLRPIVGISLSLTDGCDLRRSFVVDLVKVHVVQAHVTLA
jgi:uncharacterized membrane protein